MLFKFKSRAASDLIMLEADARKLLKIMLGDDPVQGIVLSHNLPAAITALEVAVAQDETDRKQRLQEAQKVVSEDDEVTAPVNSVSLAQRAAPMLKLLRRSLEHDKDVVWGV